MTNHADIALGIKNTQTQALLENIPKHIYMKDIYGNFVTGTKCAIELVKNKHDILTNTFPDFSKIEAVNIAEDKYVIEKNESILNEREVIDIEGKKHCYRIYKAPINDETGNVIGIIVMVNNIDSSKLLESQRETFVASVSHDLKNPTLAQIRALELLLKGHFGPLTNEQKEILEMVTDSCKYMNSMLGTLLATYRNQQGIITLKYEQFSFSELINECIEEMTYVAKDKEINIQVNDTSKQEDIWADKVQIKRVIMNLLSNGVKYAFKASSLLIDIYNKNDIICFRFRNNSPYITPEKQANIFAPYVSFAEAHKELGIGLGLYTSQKIVKAHDGEIFVQSFPDDKNIFGFKIPYKVTDINKVRTVVL